MIQKDLLDYFKIVRLLLDYKYSLNEIEQMIVFERDLYIDIIISAKSEGNNEGVHHEPVEDY